MSGRWRSPSLVLVGWPACPTGRPTFGHLGHRTGVQSWLTFHFAGMAM